MLTRRAKRLHGKLITRKSEHKDIMWKHLRSYEMYVGKRSLTEEGTLSTASEYISFKNTDEVQEN